MLNENLSLEEKIRKVKDKISDARDYISSDLCTQCVSVYKEIALLEQELKDLYDSQNQQ